jgi:FkbM family methyltransferase
MRSSGNGAVSRFGRQYLDAARFRLRGVLDLTVEVDDGSGPVRFRCRTSDEYMRATSMLAREPGTIAFLRDELRAGDHFVDIGANIGTFTLYGARRVGPSGSVSAFEPHVGTAASLLDNVAANDLQQRVRVLSCALDDRAGLFEFAYGSTVAGTALSQLRHEPAEGRATTELKPAFTLDALVEGGTLPPPDVVKLDVDGNEPAILAGMRSLLTGPARPRAIQVELNPGGVDDSARLLEECGYRLASEHRSQGAAALIAAGQPADSLGRNGIFRPIA